MKPFERATLDFARATRTILQRCPQGLSGPELRALNAGVDGIEAALGVAAASPRTHPQPAIADRIRA